MITNNTIWESFLLRDLFYIKYGNNLSLNNMTYETPTVNFVSRSAQNNGISSIVDFIPGIDSFSEGSITIALGGSIGSTFIQPEPFYTGKNVAVLLDKHNLSLEAKLFIITIIKFECSYRFYPFGRELNSYINDFSIKLPVKLNSKNNSPIIDNTFPYSCRGYIPDWEFMETYIKDIIVNTLNHFILDSYSTL